MAYVSVEAVRDSLGTEVASAHDTDIADAIAAATATIDATTGRRWEASAPEQRWFTPRRGWQVTVGIDEAQTVTEVAVLDDGSWTVLDDDDWLPGGRRVDPAAGTVAAGGWIDRLVTADGYGCWPWRLGIDTVRVTGTWGAAATVPADIGRAARLLAIRLFQRRDTPLGLASSVDGAVPLRRTDPDVYTLLQPHRRRTVR